MNLRTIYFLSFLGILMTVGVPSGNATTTNEFRNRDPSVAGPEFIIIDNDNYKKSRGDRLVSYYKQVKGRNDRNSPHITLETYEDETLDFHVTNEDESIKQKYSYQARTDTLTHRDTNNDEELHKIAKGFVKELQNKHFH